MAQNVVLAMAVGADSRFRIPLSGSNTMNALRIFFSDIFMAS
jgi:hypothetical protein